MVDWSSVVDRQATSGRILSMSWARTICHERARCGTAAALAAALLVAACGRSGNPEELSGVLTDIDGIAHGSLAEPAGARWTSLFFVRTDCPVSNQYAPEIRRICGEYGPGGMQCLLVYVDPHDSLAQVRAHRASFGYTLPALLDPGHALVGQAGARITPEVAVFGRGAKLEYLGRIDDLYTELGRPRTQVSTRDLREALDDLRDGRAVRKPRTQAIGCYIE